MISAAGSGQGEKFLLCGDAEPTALPGLHLEKPGIAQDLAKSCESGPGAGGGRAPRPGKTAGGNGRAGRRFPGGHRASTQG